MPLQSYSSSAIATLCNVSRDTVYRYHRELRARNLKQPFPARFPLEKPDAQRLMEYIQKCARQNSCN